MGWDAQGWIDLTIGPLFYSTLQAGGQGYPLPRRRGRALLATMTRFALPGANAQSRFRIYIRHCDTGLPLRRATRDTVFYTPPRWCGARRCLHTDNRQFYARCCSFASSRCTLN